jgi:hypothetical protein
MKTSFTTQEKDGGMVDAYIFHGVNGAMFPNFICNVRYRWRNVIYSLAPFLSTILISCWSAIPFNTYTRIPRICSTIPRTASSAAIKIALRYDDRIFQGGHHYAKMSRGNPRTYIFRVEINPVVRSQTRVWEFWELDSGCANASSQFGRERLFGSNMNFK